MARGFNSAAIAESVKSFNTIATLVEVIIDSSDPGYLTDFGKNITHDGKTWLPATTLGVSSIKETASTSIEKINLSLSGIPQEYVSLLLDHAYIDKSVKLHKVFLDIDGVVVGNSRLVFDGRIDSAAIVHDIDNNTATCQISASSHWIDFQKKNGRKTNDSDQQSHFSGDSCFEFAIEYDREIKWGQA